MLTVIRRLVLLAALPLALGGCDLLAYAMYPGIYDPDFTDPDFGAPGEMSTYGQGTATIEITGADGAQTVTLNEVSPGSTFDGYGAMATWRNDDGWTLELYAFGSPMYGGTSPSSGDINMKWIHDSQIWTAGSYTSTSNRCTVTMGEMTADNLSGQASCTNLEWTDGVNQFAYPPSPIEGEEPFDATITFEAQPSSNSPVSNPPASY